ncbi:prepilin-type N-terminal cleavage/methylation domain-containing protein [Pseudohongiella sp. SYSU M77423]|uniref:type IV pilus modification PilV family protein n=1 Tax=Pseudohongiella sp. SYSU M77423 TaxID=3042312 RepID=UPI0024813747|nr:prepilin-type N-terminal cleavage/methylation domain-containing protein [Pseudohongiella sp. SYSU M77423]MDH7942688.1 prepilin-type N-terminal cleavage/methylation domain-containing protein [Pseudohongiella sp. SYSU M77423]
MNTHLPEMLPVNGQRGFTIIEIVITLLVSSILAIGIVGYIGDAIEGFAASGNRNKLASSGRNVVDRLAMELHNAVPNSIRVSTAQSSGDQCLEFIPFTGASNYRDAPFTGSGGTDFEAIDFNPVLTLASPAGQYAVIYPIDTQDLYDGGSPGPRALIDEIEDTGGSDGLVTVRLDSTHRFSRRSPVERLYVADQPVSFCVENGQLFRYEQYGFQSTQCTPDTASCLPATAPNRTLISLNIDNNTLTAFEILPATLRRNAIIAMDLNFTDSGDEVRLKHEVLLRNVP